jgi:CBS domain-containing protein
MKTSVPISSLLHHKGSTMWSVAPEATVFDAIKLMADKNIGALLVMSGDKLSGLFTERDYARKIALHGKSSKQTHVKEVLSDPVTTVGPGDSIEECMKLMTEKRVRHLPVLEGGKVIGIVSIGDLVNWTISAQDAAIAQMEQYIAGGVAA